MADVNDNKLEIEILSSIKKRGIPIKALVERVYERTKGEFTRDEIREAINNMVDYKFLDIEKDLVYPPYKDYEFIITEIARLTLEIFGPLQIRDLSKYILNSLDEEDIKIMEIEGIIKSRGRRYIIQKSPPYHLKGKVSELYCLRGRIEDIGKRFREYSDLNIRHKIREELGILSEEEKAYQEKMTKKQIRDTGKHSVDEIINILKHDENIRSKIAFQKELPPKDGKYRMPNITLDEKILSYLKSKGINSLYSHQALAIEKVMSKRDVILSTSSASGKSMSYIIPIIQILIDSPNAKFLYIAPTKALAQDQKNKINEFSRAVLGKEIAKTFDGHTPYEQKQEILRKFPNLILTNEHELHYGILPNHENWRKFLKNLELIIVDEVHWYKGVFGAHVANIFRRLNIITSYYNSFPTYICLSATIGNPGEFAEKLIGKKVDVITEDSAPKPKRELVLWEPNIEDGSVFSDVAHIIGKHVAAHLMTLFFGRSRNMVEMMTKAVKEKLHLDLKDLVLYNPNNSNINR